MASHDPPALPYEAATVYYPDVPRLPRRFLLLLLLYLSFIPAGFTIISSPLDPIGSVLGPTTLFVGTAGIVSFALLYCPMATSLRIGSTGMTYSIMFWQRRIAWRGVRELRLIAVDNGIFQDLFIEVVPAQPVRRGLRGWLMRHYFEPGSWAIAARLFGCSAEAIVAEMDDWRAASIAPTILRP